MKLSLIYARDRIGCDAVRPKTMLAMSAFDYKDFQRSHSDKMFGYSQLL